MMWEMMKMIGWNLRGEVMSLNPLVDCPSPYHQFLMNTIIWNCRCALKPSFHSHVRELVQNHDPVILVLMETKIGGDRAKGISSSLPFDEAFHTDTIGYVGGLFTLQDATLITVLLCWICCLLFTWVGRGLLSFKRAG